jgi:hypothetical protein
MSELDGLSWGSCVLLLIGLHLIGDKQRIGFFVALLAEFGWIAWGALTGAWALVGMSAAISIMYVRALRKWKAES